MSGRPVAELDAGLVGETVRLAPSGGSRRELSIYRESDNGLLLRLVERIWPSSSADTAAPPQPCREVERFLDLQEDTVVPLYAISEPSQMRWNMEVLYARGKSRIAYQLSDRQEVFRMQRVLTGYRAAKHVENVRFTVHHRNQRLPVVGRALEMRGRGEVQFWRWPDSRLPSSSLAGSLLQQRGSARSMVSETVHRHSAVSVQSDNQGRERVVMISSPPPVLVVLMRDDKQYTMLKTDVTNLRASTVGTTVHLSDGRSRSFGVHTCSVKGADLKSWNIAALRGRNAPHGTKLLEATSMSLQFESAAQVEDFEKWILFLRADRFHKDKEATALRQLLQDGQMPGCSHPPALTRTTTGESSVSPSSPLSTGSAPQLPALELVEDDFWAELDAERLSQELDGKPIDPLFELSGRGSIAAG